MNLTTLIKKLEALPKNKIIQHGFGAPYSYRGIYEEVAFEPRNNTTVGEMLTYAEEAKGSTYQGWKGGSFTMDGLSSCNIAIEGECSDGDAISPTLMRYWES
jgi:hypothetical protein